MPDLYRAAVKQSLSDLLDEADSIVNARLSEIAVKGGPGSGRYPKGSGGHDEVFPSDDAIRYGSISPSDDFNSEWKNSLSDNEKLAINKYTGGGYETLNEQQRNGQVLSENNQILSDNLDHAISTAPEFENSVIVYRGVNIGDSVIAPHGAELAGLDFSERDPLIRKYVDDYAVSKFPSGAIVETLSFQSTSFKIEPALAGSVSKRSPGIIFEIKARRGAYLTGLSRYDDEDELLLPRKTKYRVVKVIRSAKFTTYDDSDSVRAIVQVEQIL